MLWVALAWQIASRFNRLLERIDGRLDRIFEHLKGLREYLYEIDPQFDDERELLDALHSTRPETMFDGMDLMELEKSKKAAGRRTLDSMFLDGGFRSPRQDDFCK